MILGGYANAAAYPWVAIRSDDIQVIADPKIEAALRLKLIRSARNSIDVLTYDQRLDPEIGMPILVALREAAVRGVRVRFMNAWFTEVVGDFYHLVPRYLTEPPTRQPIEARIIGGFGAHRRGWGLADGIHDRLLIVDGTTLLTTGRGQSAIYLRWLDTAFAIRGALVAQAIDSFDNVWRAASKDNPLFDRHGRFTTTPIPTPLLAEPELDPDETTAWARLQAWLGSEPSDAIAGRARLLHYDFLRQLGSLPGRGRGYSYNARIRLLDDPVIDALSELITNAKSAVRCTMLAVILHPKLRAALHAALENGVPIWLLTNDRSNYRALKTLPAPWWMSLPDTEDLLARGAEISAFPQSRTNPWGFMHRKTAIVGDTVIFGSHNFNLASTVASDEISFEVESPALAQELGQLFDQAQSQYGVRLDLARIHHERKLTGLARWLFRPLLGIF